MITFCTVTFQNSVNRKYLSIGKKVDAKLFLGDHAFFILWLPNVYANTLIGTLLCKIYSLMYGVAQVYFTVMSIVHNYDMDILLNLVVMLIATQVIRITYCIK